MSAASLRQAIETPARQHGLVLEPGLADLLVREIEGEPGALPLMSHALRETWLRHEGRTLTVAGYQASGGVHGAVAQSAESLYSTLDDTERAQLRDLVLRLVVPGPRGEPVRGEVPRHQMVVDPAQDRLIDRMVTARLLTSDADAIELAHEAVVRAWPRLRGWLEDDLEGQRTRHHLTQAAEDWAGSGLQDSDLYRGTRLAATREWVASSDPRLTDLERRFLAASEELAMAEEASAVELARTRGRMVRRLRFALAGAAVLLVLALITGFVAVGQTGRARDEANAARARQLSAQALGDANIPLSALLAVAAVRLDDTPQTRATLATVIARHPELVATSEAFSDAGNGNGAERLVRSPDGSRIATFDSDNVVSLIDTATGKVTARYDADGVGADDVQFFAWSALAFSPDGRTLAVGSPNYGARAVVVLDGETLQRLPDQPTHLPRWRAKAADVSFSADGRFVAASFLLLSPGYHEGGPEDPARARILVWNLSHLHRAPDAFDIPFHGFTERMALSPDGRRVYVSSPVSAYRVADGTRLWRRPGKGTWQPMGMSSGGKHLAVISGDFQNAIDVLDTSHHGRLETTLMMNGPGTLDDVTFSDDGSEVAAVGGEHELFVWDRTVPEPAQTISIDGSSGVQLNPDASRAYVSDVREGTVATWDLTGNASYLKLRAVHKKLSTIQVGFVRTSPDGTRFAEYADDLQLFNATTGRLSTAVGARDWGYYTPGSWRPDGRRFAVGGRKGWVQIFREDGRLVREARVSRVALTEVDYSADGATVGVSDASGRVALRDAESLEPVGTPVQLSGTAAAVTLAPDGRTAFVVTRRGAVTAGGYPEFQGWALLDLASGKVLHTGDLPDTAPSFDDFSPDGQHVAVGFGSGRVAILDPRAETTLAAPPPAHQAGIGWLSWSQDGSRVISADWNGDLELWDPTNGQVQDTVTTPGGVFGLGQLRSSSSHVRIVDENGRVFDWDPSHQHALDYACRLASRDLTTDEWSRYLGDQPRFQVCQP
jgi:WD40 repeat protein